MIKPGMFISDRYEIIEKVGSGGMADVYKARCHRLNRFVAIKVLKAEYSDDTTFVLKFRAEAQSVAGLSHPNIVNVYDVGDDDGLYYIVMELVEGITLKSFIERKGKLEVKEAVGIAIQIAAGLEAAHDNHIIHRDIKPQNIIISREGKVKVTDFGIAKAATSNTINSNAMGSVHYISPEQARGGYSDEKSDIYSLGITLYEMLTGRVPFGGENTVSVALAHIQETAQPIREIDPTIPLSLEKIVSKCIDKKPERRYLSAKELITDLKRSILNPNGDFVRVVAPIVDDSPTINISEEEVSQIRNASKAAGLAGAAAMAGTTVRAGGEKMETAGEEEQEFTDLEDDEDDYEIDPKLDKIMVVSGIVLAVILGIVVLVIVGFAVDLFGGKGGGDKTLPTPTPIASPTIEPTSSPATGKVAPGVTGKTLDEAKIALNNAEISYRFEEKSDDTVEAGYVISQSIPEGEPVSDGEELVLIVSTGAESFKLRDITGLDLNAAHTILTEQSLDYNHEYEYSDTVESGYVIRTSPEANSQVTRKDKITIIVSKGKEDTSVAVPDLTDMNKGEAKQALEALGLKLGKVSSDYNADYAEGIIFAQDVDAKTKVDKGTKINVTISRGPEPTVAPTATPEPTYSYKGTISKYDVFGQDYDDGAGGVTTDASGDVEIYAILNDGSTYSIVALTTMKEDEFPLEYTITSKVKGSAKVIIKRDGKQQGTKAITLN